MPNTNIRLWIACTWTTITIALCMNGHGMIITSFCALVPIISFSVLVLRLRSLSIPPLCLNTPPHHQYCVSVSVSVSAVYTPCITVRPNSESGTTLRPNLRPSIRDHQPANRTPTPDTDQNKEKPLYCTSNHSPSLPLQPVPAIGNVILTSCLTTIPATANKSTNYSHMATISTWQQSTVSARHSLRTMSLMKPFSPLSLVCHQVLARNSTNQSWSMRSPFISAPNRAAGHGLWYVHTIGHRPNPIQAWSHAK